MGRQKLGQHFLIDLPVAAREVAYAEISCDDVVLEIGPGTGVLTMLLAKQAAQVIAVEIDTTLVRQLETWMPKNVHLIHADAMKLDFQTLSHFTKIVANLPFQISSPITFKLLQQQFSKAILMYQKDFAKRMIATAGNKDYSRLSVGVSYKARCRILETIPRSCFSPQPKVDACLVELIPHVKPPFFVVDEAFFFELTKRLFIHRRKKIKQTVKEFHKTSVDQLPYMDQRVEDLTPQQIGELSNLLYAACMK